MTTDINRQNFVLRTKEGSGLGNRVAFRTCNSTLVHGVGTSLEKIRSFFKKICMDKEAI